MSSIETDVQGLLVHARNFGQRSPIRLERLEGKERGPYALAPHRGSTARPRGQSRR